MARLKTLLKSNDAPLDEDLAQIHMREKDLARERADVQLEMASLQTQIDLLANRERVCTSEMDSIRVVTSPCRRLPNEVLCEIFLHLAAPASSDPATPFHSSLDVTKGPWLLSYVCRRWRQVSLSCSSLWTSITVVMRPRSPDSEDLGPSSNAFLLGLQLARSGNSLLDVVIRCEKILVEPTNPYIMMLALSTQRWRKFTLAATQASIIALSSVLHLFPLLRVFIVAQHPQSQELPVPSLEEDAIPLLQHCTTIRAFAHSHFPLETRFRTIAWHRLYNLTISECHHDLKSLLYALAQTAMLRYLDMQFVRLHASDSEFSNSPVVIPNLRRLTLFGKPSKSETHEGTYATLLQAIVAPRLQSLRVTVATSNLDHLDIFIERSECAVTTLVLGATLGSKIDARHLWSSLLDVRSVTILPATNDVGLRTLSGDFTASHETATERSEDVNETPIFPQLSTLLIQAPVTDETVGLVSRLLLSRASGIGRRVDDGSVQALRKVSLASVVKTDEFTDAVERCRASGMAIDCNYVQSCN